METTFFLRGNVVGYFEQRRPPSRGEFRYTPYRGQGLWSLEESLSCGPQRCYFVMNGAKHYFTVTRIVSNGVLEISEAA